MVMCRSKPALEPRDMAGAARGWGGAVRVQGPAAAAGTTGALPGDAPTPRRRRGARRSRTVTVRQRRCACPSPAAAARCGVVWQHVRRQAELGQRRRRRLWGSASASRSWKPETRRTGLRECARKQRETGKKYHRGIHQHWIKVSPASRENKTPPEITN